MKHLDQLGCLWAWSCTHVQDLHRNYFLKFWCHFIVTNTDSCGRTIRLRSLKDIWQSLVSAKQLLLSCVFPSDQLPSKTAFVAVLNTDFQLPRPIEEQTPTQLSCSAAGNSRPSTLAIPCEQEDHFNQNLELVENWFVWRHTELIGTVEQGQSS